MQRRVPGFTNGTALLGMPDVRCTPRGALVPVGSEVDLEATDDRDRLHAEMLQEDVVARLDEEPGA
jgi:hypothetical protein